MECISKIVKELEKTSSTNSKIQILKREENNKLFKKVLYYTYSDNLQYGFSEKKLSELLESHTVSDKSVWSNVFDMLTELSISNINDSLRGKVKSFLLFQSEEIRKLYIKILTKDLRCNISAKTINKAIKGLINVWEIQQAYPIDNVKLKKGEWIALSLKLNGIRSSFLNDVFRSRQNKIMEGYEHIVNDLKRLGIDHFFVDGEMIRKNVNNVSDEENFRLTTSIVNSDDSDKTQLKLVIFDIITKQDFLAGKSLLTFKDRLNILNILRERIEELELKHIEIAPTYYVGTDHSMIEELLEKVDAEGLEGLMCLRDMPYKTKRNNGILKVKSWKHCDILIIGFEEGEGKLKGTLGSIIADYKGNPLGVGSGYTDLERNKIWSDKDNLLGRIVQVKYKTETKDKKTKLLSVQFPTFVCIREIGKEISYN
jgi:DNA ligase 1